MDRSDYSRILRNWRLEPADEQPDTELPGSPDRTASRAAVNDTAGNVWVLEEIAEDQYARKLEIAETMEFLKSRALGGIHPYERNTLGQFVTCYAGRLCMLRPHVGGIALDRATWLDDTWRADAMAGFLIELSHLSEEAPPANRPAAFSIIDFVKRRTEAFARHRPGIAESLTPVYRNLETHLFEKLPTRPTGFCHGDFHPLNVVWGDGKINSVIDWEFCGEKPEAYDAALLVGCIGFDDPDALLGDLATTFVHKLRDARIYSTESWACFLDLVVAIRYAWLAEWMRTNDESARDLEMLYMNLLTTQKGYILNKWGLV